MGLSEKKAIRDYQDGVLPQMVAEVHGVLGYPLPVEFDWPTFPVDRGPSMYASDSAFNASFVGTLLEALRGLAVDDMSKDAMREGLKKVTFKFDDGTYDLRNSSFDAGHLVIAMSSRGDAPHAGVVAALSEMIGSKL